MRQRRRKTEEEELQENIIKLAKLYRYLAYHTYDSRRSAAGFPDLVLARPGEQPIFAELKSTNGKLTPAQAAWKEALAPHWHLWRPSDWMDGTIERTLKPPVYQRG